MIDIGFNLSAHNNLLGCGIGQSNACTTASPRLSGWSEYVRGVNVVACRPMTTMDASFAVEVQSIRIWLFNRSATGFVNW